MKRAILVAAAGGHSLLIVGSKGVGKTMLRALASELGLDETFEGTCCPCGKYTDPKAACNCTPEEIEAWRREWPEADMTIEAVPVPERE